MEVWTARFVVNSDCSNDNKLCVYFKFKKEDNDNWELTKDKTQFCSRDEWSWFYDYIPSKIKVEVDNMSCVASAEQGFDRELTKEEKEELMLEMKELIIKALNKKKENLMNTLQRQLDFITNNEVKII